MKKLFVISALGFFLLAALVFLYILNPSFVQNTTKAIAEKVPLVRQEKKATLSLLPAKIDGNVGKIMTLSVGVDAGGLKVSGAQFSLNYDPQRIEVESIKASNFFDRPTILLSRANRAMGNYEFAVGSLTPKSGRGTLAEISVKLLTAGEPTVLEFSKDAKIAAIELGSANAGDKFLPATITVK